MKQDPRRNPRSLAFSAHAEHDQLILRLLADSAKLEAKEWLERTNDGKIRTLGGFKTKRDSLAFIKHIYDLGALKVFAVNIQTRAAGAWERTGKLVVELPQKSRLRKAIFEWCREMGESVGFSPDPDHGESHLFLLLD